MEIKVKLSVERIQRPTTAGEVKFERPVARVEEVCPEAVVGTRWRRLRGAVRDGVRTPFAAAASDAEVTGAASHPPYEPAMDCSSS